MLELGLGALILVVFFAGLFGGSDDRRSVGVVASSGSPCCSACRWRMEPGRRAVRRQLRAGRRSRSSPSGCSWSPRHRRRWARSRCAAAAFARAGDRVLPGHPRVAARHAGARLRARADPAVRGLRADVDPALLLTGFHKREEEAVGGARSSSSWSAPCRPRCSSTACRSSTASTGTTDARRHRRARCATGHPLLLLGMVLALGGLGFKIAAFPFHMWVPDAYEAASTPFVAWLSVAPKAAGFVVMFRLYLEGVGERGAALGAARRRARRAHDHRRQPDGDPPAEHQAAARLFRHRAHRLHADRLRRGLRGRASR